MLAKFRDPEGNPVIINTDFLMSIASVFQGPPAQQNGRIPVIGEKPQRILNRSALILSSGQQAIVMGDPEDIYERIKKRDIEKTVTES